LAEVIGVVREFLRRRTVIMTGKVIVTPTDGGPYQIRGRIRLVLPSGRTIETEEEMWLCRCGGSGNKPFCDGTHKKIGFNALDVGVDDAEKI
jgi:CDGSH iron-sulfur domain-containing protein 3